MIYDTKYSRIIRNTFSCMPFFFVVLLNRYNNININFSRFDRYSHFRFYKDLVVVIAFYLWKSILNTFTFV